jgi:membrane protein implicated in regulation of membrane protease activity
MTIAYWHWLIFGFCMIAAEVMIPGAFFIWIGSAALALSSLVFLFPMMEASNQFVIFGILGPLFAIIGKKVVRKQMGTRPQSLLNRRAQQFIGQIITLDVPIVHGHAHVAIGDSKWRVKGPDLPAGVDVKIVDIEENMLIVVAVPLKNVP